MSIEVKVPTLGESVSEATVGQWLKKPGDTVAVDEPIASLETDKVAVEVPAPAAGVIGQRWWPKAIPFRSALLGDRGRRAAAAPATAAAPALLPAPAAAAAPAATADADAAVLSPAVRRAVLEHGIDPSTVKGTGKDGRLTKEDVLSAAQAKQAAPAPLPAAPLQRPPPRRRRNEARKMTRLRQTIAKRLKSAQENAALLTTFNDVDMGAVMEARAKYKDVFERSTA
jgi:2-oxoglutarate dehydrogenase E2 component (dihydrolipoamide succinyltransferase)